MATRKSPLEDSVENYLVDRVKELGGFALKGDIKGQRFLDRIIILPGGLTFWCECKRPEGGRYSKHQEETLRRLEWLGHSVLRVSTRAEVDAFIRNGGARRATPAPEPHLPVDVDRLAARIVTAACELDGPADPASDVTISITMKDLEVVVHRHVTAALEASE